MFYSTVLLSFHVLAAAKENVGLRRKDVKHVKHGPTNKLVFGEPPHRHLAQNNTDDEEDENKKLEIFKSNNTTGGVFQIQNIPSKGNEGEGDSGQENNDPTPHGVCGKDDRTRVSQTTSYPWKSIAYLRITFEDDDYDHVCTGFFISKRVVMTAAHCVYDHHENLGKAYSVNVCPGRNGGNSYPYGCQYANSYDAPYQEWEVNADLDYDYAALILPDTTMYDKGVGYFGFADYSSYNLRNFNGVNFAGFPIDKTLGTMWHDYAPISNVWDRYFSYNHDTYEGMNGGPVWVYYVDEDGEHQHRVVGINAHENIDGGCPNYAVRVNDDVYDFMLSKRNMYG